MEFVDRKNWTPADYIYFIECRTSFGDRDAADLLTANMVWKRNNPDHTCFGDTCMNPRCDRISGAIAESMGVLTFLRDKTIAMWGRCASNDGENIPFYALEDHFQIIVDKLNEVAEDIAIAKRHKADTERAQDVQEEKEHTDEYFDLARDMAIQQGRSVDFVGSQTRSYFQL